MDRFTWTLSSGPNPPKNNHLDRTTWTIPSRLTVWDWIFWIKFSRMHIMVSNVGRNVLEWDSWTDRSGWTNLDWAFQKKHFLEWTFLDWIFRTKASRVRLLNLMLDTKLYGQKLSRLNCPDWVLVNLLDKNHLELWTKSFWTWLSGLNCLDWTFWAEAFGLNLRQWWWNVVDWNTFGFPFLY